MRRTTPPPDASRPARIRHLLARAGHQRGAEHFWTLAVAMQLIEDHRAALAAQDALACGQPHHRRAQRAQAAWKVRLRDVATLLDRSCVGETPTK